MFRSGEKPDHADYFDDMKNGGCGAYKYPHFPTVWDTLEQMPISENGLPEDNAVWCDAIAVDFVLKNHEYQHQYR